MYPKGHPYSWTVIGEMKDLNAASLDDVHNWFKQYYGPNNAVIAIAGDITPEEAKEKVEKYFGDIPPGPTLARHEVNIPRRTSNSRQVYEDRVPQVRIVQSWVSPQYGSEQDAYFDLIASILSTGKNSRLYKELVYTKQTASSVNAYQSSSEIASTFNISANVRPGQSAEMVEQDLIRILDEFIANGPTTAELNRAKSTYFSSFIKGLERIGGFGGKSDILASNLTYFGDPEHYKKVHQYVENATAEDLQKAAKEWLSIGKHTLLCKPFPEYMAGSKGVDRSKLPDLGEAESVKFPEVQRKTLKNGMEIVLSQRKDVPTVVMNLMINAGYAADQFAIPGTASLALNMMDEGTKTYNSLEINEKLQMYGASLNAGSDLDYSYVRMNTLLPSLDQSLALYADVVLNPAFPEKEFQRLQQEQLVGIQREKSQPVAMALRVMPKFLYGENHAYSLPLTGSGYEETVSKLTREDMIKFYDQWIKPNNATLVVVGDISMDELSAKIEKYFGKWKKGNVPEKNISPVKTAKKNTLYLMDRPESQQSVIIAGHLTNPYGDVSEIANEAGMNVFGGEFTSRLNMNLREDKHWAYGAFGFVMNAKAQRPFLAYAPVQTDKTRESVMEIMKEVSMLVGDKPITEAELSKVKTNRVLQLPGQWETNSSVSSSLSNIVKYDLGDDYYKSYDSNVRNLSLQEVRDTMKEMVRPGDMNWFMVGDKAKILKSLEEVGFDEIVLIDADGNPLEPSGKIETEGK